MYAIFVLLVQRHNFLDPLIYATSENKLIKLHTISRLSPRRIRAESGKPLRRISKNFAQNSRSPTFN